MITCRCPKCNKTFRHENVEAVFCPHCKTVLCEVLKQDDGIEPTCNDNPVQIPVGLIFAVLVVVANAFVVSLLSLFTWAAMENQSGRGFLLFSNGTLFSIPAIFCFFKYRECWWILAIAAVFGILACFVPIYIGPLLTGR